MKLFYSDEKNNKIYIPEDENLQPKGRWNHTFIGGNSTIIIGNNVRFVKCQLWLEESGVIEVQDNCVIHGSLVTQHSDSRIIIGRNTKFDSNSRLHAAEGRQISIGSDCLLRNVRFRTSDSHPIYDQDMNRINPAQDIILEDNVLLDEEVYIYKGVRIGQGAVVAACSTVTQDIPAHTLSEGKPAKPIRDNITWK